MRIILAAIVGGILMFAWGFVWHAVFPFAHQQLQQVASDEPVMKTLHENLKVSGMYMFPRMDMSETLSKEQREAEEARWTEKYKTGPHGLIIYTQNGSEPMSPKQLGCEFISNVICALFAAIIISKTKCSYLCRVVLVTCVGLASVAAIDASYHNWYGFPTGHVINSAIEQGVGFFLIGLGVSAIVKKAE